uniref:Uncharacterized protein n=1 Tax=Heterosigma akashiwo TaxID=2829 RepID=A0A7S3UW10_HETAK
MATFNQVQMPVPNPRLALLRCSYIYQGKIKIKWTSKLNIAGKFQETGTKEEPDKRRIVLWINRANAGVRHRTCLESFADHEICTHALRALNDRRQPWAAHRKRYGLHKLGSRISASSEEGLACLHTCLAREKGLRLLASPALLYYAACKGRELPFRALWEALAAYVRSPAQRYWLCVRVKKGILDPEQPGSVGKSQIYLEGAVEILKKLRSIDFRLMYSGKVSVDCLGRARRVRRAAGVVLPRFMDDYEGYIAQLEEIAILNGIEVEPDPTPQKENKGVGVETGMSKVQKKAFVAACKPDTKKKLRPKLRIKASKVATASGKRRISRCRTSAAAMQSGDSQCYQPKGESNEKEQLPSSSDSPVRTLRDLRRLRKMKSETNCLKKQVKLPPASPPSRCEKVRPLTQPPTPVSTSPPSKTCRFPETSGPGSTTKGHSMLGKSLADLLTSPLDSSEQGVREQQRYQKDKAPSKPPAAVGQPAGTTLQLPAAQKTQDPLDLTWPLSPKTQLSWDQQKRRSPCSKSSPTLALSQGNKKMFAFSSDSDEEEEDGETFIRSRIQHLPETLGPLTIGCSQASRVRGLKNPATTSFHSPSMKSGASEKAHRPSSVCHPENHSSSFSQDNRSELVEWFYQRKSKSDGREISLKSVSFGQQQQANLELLQSKTGEALCCISQATPPPSTNNHDFTSTGTTKVDSSSPRGRRKLSYRDGRAKHHHHSHHQHPKKLVVAANLSVVNIAPEF